MIKAKAVGGHRACSLVRLHIDKQNTYVLQVQFVAVSRYWVLLILKRALGWSSAIHPGSSIWNNLAKPSEFTKHLRLNVSVCGAPHLCKGLLLPPTIESIHYLETINFEFMEDYFLMLNTTMTETETARHSHSWPWHVGKWGRSPQCNYLSTYSGHTGCHLQVLRHT